MFEKKIKQSVWNINQIQDNSQLQSKVDFRKEENIFKEINVLWLMLATVFSA